ncbi:MAG: immunoglobulin domain-containing protein [Bacteroidales bacterium]
MKKIILTTAILILAGISPALAQHRDTLHPVADAYIVTMGGGGGKNTFMKFDISSIPPRSVVSNATLMVYVSFKSLNWNSNCRFMNVHSQNWTESDQETTLWGYQRSDTVLQAINFGMMPGWTSSVDLKAIFLRDYNQSNSFCTMMLKDPDDPTIAPGGISPASNLKDSLIVGNIFNDYIIFYPREATNQNYVPRFIISYKIAPTVIVQPVNHTVCEGDNVNINITASGDTSLHYQWQRNDTNIDGATSNIYAINNITSISAGKYRCIVTNSVGADTSIESVLTVNPSPIAYNVTGGGSYCAGGTGLDVGLSGSTVGINYDLFADGTTTGIIIAGTGNTISFGSQTAASCYTVMATNTNTSCANIMTGNTCITINALPIPAASASPDTVCQGNCTTLYASGGTSYIWSSGNTNVCPANTATYTVTVTNAGGCSATDSVSVYVGTCTGIAESPVLQKTILSPNPFSSFSEITSDKDFNNAELTIYDASGNTVKQIKNISGNTIFISRQGMTNGTYFYKISGQHMFTSSGEFIVN